MLPLLQGGSDTIDQIFHNREQFFDALSLFGPAYLFKFSSLGIQTVSLEHSICGTKKLQPICETGFGWLWYIASKATNQKTRENIFHFVLPWAGFEPKTFQI